MLTNVRTNGNFSLYRQRSLFHSLHVFSLKCDDCQYCQGMGSIAANLLCYYSAEVRLSYSTTSLLRLPLTARRCSLLVLFYFILLAADLHPPRPIARRLRPA